MYCFISWDSGLDPDSGLDVSVIKVTMITHMQYRSKKVITHEKCGIKDEKIYSIVLFPTIPN